MTEKQALKIHGFVFSSGSDDDSSGLSEFDDAYYAARPPPIPLQGLENRIVRIRALSNNEVSAPRTQKEDDQGKAPNTALQRAQGAAPKNKGKQQKKRANHKSPKLNNQFFESPSASPSHALNYRRHNNENRNFDFQRQEQMINALIASTLNIENLDLNVASNSSCFVEPPQPRLTTENSFRLNENCYVGTSRELGGNTNKNKLRGRVASIEPPAILDINRLPNLPPPINYAEAAKSLVVKKPSTYQDFTAPSASRANEIDQSRDSGIFTLFPPESERNGSIKVNKPKTRKQSTTVPVTSQPISVRPVDVPVQSRIVRQEEDATSTRSTGTRFVYALRRFFCCDVDEEYAHM